MWLRPPLWANDVAFAFGFLPTKTRRKVVRTTPVPACGEERGHHNCNVGVKNSERSEVSRTAQGTGGEALLRTRVGERTDVGWAWRGRCSLPSRRRPAHALPPGRHGDRTRPAPAPALARRPGAAPASGGPRRGPREQRVQVTVPSLHPPCRPFPFLFLGTSVGRRWRLL